MMHSAPGLASAMPALSSLSRTTDLFLPRGAKPAPRPPRPAFKMRRYDVQWLGADGQIACENRTAPALPEFEEAFSALARGTVIDTTEGPVAIEDLMPGMRVVTGEGRIETVTWIGSMTLFPPNMIPGIASSAMTRITADAFGGGKPMPDILLGPDARLLMRNARTRAAGHSAAYCPARGLIDGLSVIEVTPVAPVTVYNVILENHGSLRCAGIEVESFHPGKNPSERFDPQLGQLFLALFPQINGWGGFGPMAHARLSEEEAADLIAA
jgi:hypothetical protein